MNSVMTSAAKDGKIADSVLSTVLMFIKVVEFENSRIIRTPGTAIPTADTARIIVPCVH